MIVDSSTSLMSVGKFLSKFFLFSQAIFFLVFYGLFHLIYIFFIKLMFPAPVWPAVFLGSSLFFADHLYSEFTIKKQRKEPETIITQWKKMRRVLQRVFPIHIIIILYGFLVVNSRTSGLLPLTIFLFLKAALDIKGQIDAKRDEERQSIAKELADTFGPRANK